MPKYCKQCTLAAQAYITHLIQLGYDAEQNFTQGVQIGNNGQDPVTHTRGLNFSQDTSPTRLADVSCSFAKKGGRCSFYVSCMYHRQKYMYRDSLENKCGRISYRSGPGQSGTEILALNWGTDGDFGHLILQGGRRGNHRTGHGRGTKEKMLWASRANCNHIRTPLRGTKPLSRNTNSKQRMVESLFLWHNFHHPWVRKHNRLFIPSVLTQLACSVKVMVRSPGSISNFASCYSLFPRETIWQAQLSWTLAS